MVTTLLACRARKQELEDYNDTTSEHYHQVCHLLQMAEGRVGADWDGVTVLQDNNDEPALAMPGYIDKATKKGDIKTVLRWIDSNRTEEDRVNAISTELRVSLMYIASLRGNVLLMTLLLQLGATFDFRDSNGNTVIAFASAGKLRCATGLANEIVMLLLSWGASFFPEEWSSRDYCIAETRNRGAHELANLLKSDLGGRRCEVVNLSSRPEVNGKTCVAEAFFPVNNQYKVTLETKSKEVLVLGPDNLKRRDRTPQDCGYYIEFKNGRTTRHDFDSSADCQAFVAALNGDEKRPAVTEEAEARAEQAAAELLAELDLDDIPNNVPSGDGQAKKSKKKKKCGKKKKQ